MISKKWIDRSAEIVNEIPDEMLSKLAYLKMESLISLFMMISIEAQLYAEGKNLKDLKI